MQRLHGCGGFIMLYLALRSQKTHNIDIPKGSTSIKLHGFLTAHPRAEPYRIEHSSSQFGSACILFEPYIIEREHWDLDSVRLALENFERGGDSARKCSVRFGTARGCTVRGAHSARSLSKLYTSNSEVSCAAFEE